MTTLSSVFELECPPAIEAHGELVLGVQQGLRSRPRSLKPWMFYDDVGSRLFERITTLPEYYPTRTERALLEEQADAIVTSVWDGCGRLRVVELGAGSASKTCVLLGAAARRRLDVVYMPLDVSAEALDMACRNVGGAFPNVVIEPIVVNYVETPPQLEPFNGPTLALYLGTSIGNFTPGESQTILRNLGSQLGVKDAFLLGADLVKDELTLLAAYQDGEGVTAAFNLNILNRLNKELDADFNLSGFRHCARWNSIESRIEMHLVSIRCQKVQIPGAELNLDLRPGETIHTESSYKFTDETLSALLAKSGFQLETTWKDLHDWYALTLSRRCEQTSF